MITTAKWKPFSQAIKHEKPRMTKINLGIYISWQKVSDAKSLTFCSWQISKQQTLTNKRPEVPTWILENTFECLMLISQMIVKHRGYLDGDLFHERSNDVDAKAHLLADKKIEQKQGKKGEKRKRSLLEHQYQLQQTPFLEPNGIELCTHLISCKFFAIWMASKFSYTLHEKKKKFTVSKE